MNFPQLLTSAINKITGNDWPAPGQIDRAHSQAIVAAKKARQQQTVNDARKPFTDAANAIHDELIKRGENGQPIDAPIALEMWADGKPRDDYRREVGQELAKLSNGDYGVSNMTTMRFRAEDPASGEQAWKIEHRFTIEPTGDATLYNALVAQSAATREQMLDAGVEAAIKTIEFSVKMSLEEGRDFREPIQIVYTKYQSKNLTAGGGNEVDPDLDETFIRDFKARLAVELPKASKGKFAVAGWTPENFSVRLGPVVRAKNGDIVGNQSGDPNVALPKAGSSIRDGIYA